MPRDAGVHTATLTRQQRRGGPGAPAGERFQPGTLLAGRYRVTHALGRGGMGEVYRADDVRLGVPVALKLLPAELSRDEESLNLLLNEARLARSITHTNVCRIHDVGESDGLHFISMELIAGEDLTTLLRRIGRLPQDKAIDVARGLCAGLDAAHGQGVLHRDLKPANVMIDDDGEVRITDFGLSHHVGAAAAMERGTDAVVLGPTAGTPAYMAPEQTTGGEVSVRTDLYALGLVLYEAFTGHRAFQAESAEELARLHLEAPPPLPSDVVRELDPTIETVILRCLEKDPRARPTSAKVVAAALPGHSAAPKIPDDDGWRPAPGLPLPGRDRWTIDKKVGEGGFGEVWLARHEKTRERRVFKFCYEASRLRSLQREITLFRLLKEELGERDDMARILDWNFDEAPYFVESEYTAGGDLVEWAKARGGIGQVPLAERLEIIAQVGDALAAAHSVGVLHKDVKPANVLIWRDSEGRTRTRLTDFGIGGVTDHERLAAAGITSLGLGTAGDSARGDRPASPGGTRLYMAPELLEGKPATVQADVYALGVMLYQVLTGDLGRALAPGWQREIRRCLPPLIPLREHGEVDAELLREDVSAAVDGDAGRRLADAGELARRLRQLDERRAERQAAQQLRDTLERATRRRRQAIAAAAVLATVAAVVLASWRLVREERDRAKDLARTAVAGVLLAEHQTTQGNLVALEVRRPTSNAVETLRKALAQPVYLAAVGDGAGAAPADGRCPPPLRPDSWSPDGKRLLADDGPTLRICDARTFQELHRLRGHTDDVVAASWNADGSRVLTASEDGTARIWSTGDGEELRRIDAGAVQDASWSHDDSRVLTVASTTVTIWNAATGDEVFRIAGHTARIHAASWSADSSSVLTASADRKACTWDAAAGEQTLCFAGHEESVVDASWSGDGRRVLTVSDDLTARIWDARTGREITRFAGHQNGIHSASWNRDGRRVLTASWETARIWDAATGEELTSLRGHTDDLHSAAWSHDGRRVLTASADRTARIWDARTGREIARMGGHADTVSAAAWSPDDTLVLAVSWNAAARTWNTRAGDEAARLEGHTDAVLTVAWNADGSRLLTASDDRTARAWDAVTGEETVRFVGHDGGVSSAVWSADGERVLTASFDKTARIWDARTGEETSRFVGHDHAVSSAVWSADGERVLTASFDKTARIWDARTGEETVRFVGHADDISSAVWNADGTRVLTASFDRSARIWDARTGEETARFEGHDALRSAAFSTGDRYVVTTALNTTALDTTALDTTAIDKATVRTWDVATGEEVPGMDHPPAPTRGTAWSADGRRVARTDGWTARVLVVSDEDAGYLRGRVRARTPLCLDAPFRQATLGEPDAEARRATASCEACVPVFFARLGAEPAPSERYAEAWRSYASCLGR